MIEVTGDPKGEQVIVEGDVPIGKLLFVKFSDLPAWTWRYGWAKQLCLVEDGEYQDTEFVILSSENSREFCILHRGKVVAELGSTDLDYAVTLAVRNVGNF